MQRLWPREDEMGKEGEAGDAFASSMEPDAAQRSRSRPECYRTP
jgi:hypothetical protein